MVKHLVQFQKGLGSSPGPAVTFHAAIGSPLTLKKKLPTIWGYMKSKWKQSFPKTQWLQLTIELVRGLGSIQLRKSPRWMSEAYIERITEAIWVI